MKPIHTVVLSTSVLILAMSIGCGDDGESSQGTENSGSSAQSATDSPSSDGTSGGASTGGASTSTSTSPSTTGTESTESTSDSSSGGDSESGSGTRGTTTGGTDNFAACAGDVEGFAASTPGGAGGDVYTVTTLADSGEGSLRDGIDNREGPRVIEFGVSGTIALESVLRIDDPFLTIDGCSADAPGITISPIADDVAAIQVNGTHDVILRSLRLLGQWDTGEPHTSTSGLLGLDGDAGDGVVANVLVDHLTVRKANDIGVSIWGSAENVTIAWTLFAQNNRTTTTSYHSGNANPEIRRVDYHHNVITQSVERNPQVRIDGGVLTDFVFVNNVVHEWSWGAEWGYGIRVGRDGEDAVDGTFVGNAFASSVHPENAVLQWGGDQFWDDTIVPTEAESPMSTIGAPLATYSEAGITAFGADQLDDEVLPHVGVRDRDATEDELIAGVGPDLP